MEGRGMEGGEREGRGEKHGGRREAWREERGMEEKERDGGRKRDGRREEGVRKGRREGEGVVSNGEGDGVVETEGTEGERAVGRGLGVVTVRHSVSSRRSRCLRCVGWSSCPRSVSSLSYCRCWCCGCHVFGWVSVRVRSVVSRCSRCSL